MAYLARLAFAFLGVSLASCSLATTSRNDCLNDDACVASFGSGAQCVEDGFCMRAEACTATAECQRRIGFGSVCNAGACVDAVAPPRCGETFPPNMFDDLEPHRERVVFGAILDQSVPTHVQRGRAMELAVFQLIENGGLQGRPLGLVYCDIDGGPDNPYDGMSRPDAALSTSEWLVDELQVPAIVGPPSSGDTARVFEQFIDPARPRTVQLTPSGTGPSLTALEPPASDDAPGLLWRTAGSASTQASVIAQDMASRNDVTIDRVAIIAEEDDFGQGVAQAFVAAWSGEAQSFTFLPGNSSQRDERIIELAIALGPNDIDAVLFIGQVDDARAFLTLATTDDRYGDDLPLYFPDSGAGIEVFSGTTEPRLFDNVRATRQSLPSGIVFQNFRAAFQTRFNADPADSTFTANAFDAIWLLALGASRATSQDGGISGLGIAHGLRRSVGGEMRFEFRPSVWEELRSAVESGERVDVVGASGELDFDSVTEEASVPTDLLEGTAEGMYQVLREQQ